MSPESKDMISKLAERIARNPMTATADDARKLAAAWLLQTTGRARPVAQRRRA